MAAALATSTPDAFFAWPGTGIPRRHMLLSVLVELAPIPEPKSRTAPTFDQIVGSPTTAFVVEKEQRAANCA
jgi:hypothetical protein